MFFRAAQEITKKNKKQHLNMIFHPFAGASVRPTFTVFGMWGQITDVIAHVKFQIDRSRGFGATGAQNRGFPIDLSPLQQCCALTCYTVINRESGRAMQNVQSDS